MKGNYLSVLSFDDAHNMKTIRIFDVRADNTVNAPDTCEVMAPRAKPASATIDEGASTPSPRLLKAAL